MKAFLVCLLLLLTPVDDVVLAAPPGAQDDGLAAQNNDYVVWATRVQVQRPERDLAGHPARPDGSLSAVVPHLPAAGRFARPALSALMGANPIYLLMSLQR
jgi:hypothetical protein